MQLNWKWIAESKNLMLRHCSRISNEAIFTKSSHHNQFLTSPQKISIWTVWSCNQRLLDVASICGACLFQSSNCKCQERRETCSSAWIFAIIQENIHMQQEEFSTSLSLPLTLSLSVCRSLSLFGFGFTQCFQHLAATCEFIDSDIFWYWA